MNTQMKMSLTVLVPVLVIAGTPVGAQTPDELTAISQEIKTAVNDHNVDAFLAYLTDMNAVVYGPDPLSMAKLIHAFREKNNLPKVRAALVDGQPVGPEKVAELSKLPGRDQLLGHFLATLQAPASTFVRLLNEVSSQFVRLMAAVRDSKEKSA